MHRRPMVRLDVGRACVASPPDRKPFPADLPDGLKPRLRLFLSIDLVGSTAFKQSRLAWLPAILDFYRDFDQLMHAQFRAYRQRSNCPVPPPEFWKSNGDELLYTRSEERRVGK